MTAIAFDTLRYVKTLRAAGFDEQQAEALTEGQREILSANLDDLATKRDMTELKVELKRDIKELELRMVIKMGVMILGGVGLVVTANRLWPVPVQYVPAGLLSSHQMPIVDPGAGKSPVLQPALPRTAPEAEK